jgi:hypothetical protein
MKTKEKIKTEVFNYLKKSSNHLFKIGDLEHKVLFNDNFIIRITGNDIKVTTVDYYINCWGNNAKNVIKNDLFLVPRYYNKDIETIKNYKLARQKYSSILESIKDKDDKNEILSIIKNML